jgi:hypothetical protein
MPSLLTTQRVTNTSCCHYSVQEAMVPRLWSDADTATAVGCGLFHMLQTTLHVKLVDLSLYHAQCLQRHAFSIEKSDQLLEYIQ